jgi:acyl carrier protein
MMAAKTRDSVARMMRAKVAGTLVLEDLLQGDQLHFLVLCSSISAVLGGLGLSDYAGANSFLDAFARSTRLRALGTLVTSINWDTWREVGMRAVPPPDPSMPAALRRRASELLDNAIAPGEGVDVFDRILDSGLSEVVVSTRDLHALIQGNRPVRHDGVGDAERPDGPGAAGDGRALSLHQRSVEPSHVRLENETERTIADIWQNLLGVDQIGAGDDFFDLGGHSLLATQVLARLQPALGVELSLRLLFEARTVRELAQRIQEIRSAPAPGPDADDPDREEIEL